MERPEFDYAVKLDEESSSSYSRKHKFIRFHYKNGSTDDFLRVCGGLSWSTVEASAYFTCLAQRREENEFRKKPLIQVLEFEDEGSIDGFFERVRKAASRFQVSLIFTDVENSSFYTKFSSRHYYLLQGVTGSEDFNYGLSIIRAWGKKNALETMEGSILRSQLSSLRESDLRESPERKFNAVNALRYVVSGFDDWEEGRFNPINFDSVFV